MNRDSKDLARIKGSAVGERSMSFTNEVHGHALSKQELLFKILKKKSNRDNSLIVVTDRAQVLPLSWEQQQLWFISTLDAEASQAYHVHVIFRLHGNLNRDALDRAFEALLIRHEILRTNILVTDQGEAYQHIHPESQCQIELLPLLNKDIAQCELEYRALLSDFVSRPFDLSADSLIRAALIKHADNDHSLALVLHHVATDAWSMGVLTQDLSTLYAAYCKGEKAPLQPLQIQYADYAHWQRKTLLGEAMEREAAYWREALNGVPLLALPTDKQRPPIRSFKGAFSPLEVDAEIVKGIKALGQQHGCTMFMTLLAIFNVLLNRYTQQADLCVGTPVANRRQAEIQPLIGYFVNTLAIRTQIDDQRSFIDLLANIKRSTLSAYEHQTLPFERVVAAVHPERSPAYSPLFQVMLVLQNVKGSNLAMADLDVGYENADTTHSKFDLTLVLEEMPGGVLRGGVEYATDLFNEATIISFKKHFIELIKSVQRAPQSSLCQLNYLTKEENHRLLVQWNQTSVKYSHDKCIHRLFEEQVELTPTGIAVVFEGQSLTYEQLNCSANRLAHYLIERGVKADSLVGLCTERSFEMVIGLLGIIKAGGAYVPLDPDYPEARLEFIQQDADLSIVLTQTQHKNKIRYAKQHCLCLDDVDFIAELNQYEGTNPNLDVREELSATNLAYVIYTSGSTGMPKGVLLEHRALVNRIEWMDHQYGCDQSDVVLQKTPFSFDVSVWEFFWPLIRGAQLVMAKPSGHKDPVYLAEVINKNHITKLHFVPSMLNAMLYSSELVDCKSLKQVFCSGEALQPSHCTLFFQQCPQVQLHNLYGPTEAAIDVSYWSCQSTDESQFSSIPIGRPIQNIHLYVLSKDLKPVPVGIAGELHISGVGLARGYLNRFDLTQEKFIPNPFANSPYDRLYKTGDLCRFLADGTIEYIGRIDHQVKIRGFRIELGEIETALNNYPLINDAVVIVGKNSNAQNLYAFFVAEDVVDTAELISTLRKKLPDYMVPKACYQLDNIPLTANGKADNGALINQLANLSSLEKREQTHVRLDSLEERLRSIWWKYIAVKEVWPEDNFFDLGGNSMDIIMLHYGIAKEFDVKIKIAHLFESPTLREQAKLIGMMLKNGRKITNLTISSDQHADCEEGIELAVKHIAREHGVSLFDMAYVENNIFAKYSIEEFSDKNSILIGVNRKYKVYCLSKALISHVVLILVERGKLDLNANIASYLPDILNVKSPLRLLTLRQLLSHSAGIDDSALAQIHLNCNNLDDYLLKTEDHNLLFQAGDSCAYSSSGFIITAKIIEVVTGHPWKTALDEYLFKPLGIFKGSPTEIPDDSQQKITLNMSERLAYIMEPAQSEVLALSVMDLIKITHVVINEGCSLHGERLISAEAASLMCSSVATVENHFIIKEWGLGWFGFGHDVFGYITGENGQNTLVAIQKSQKKAIVVQNIGEKNVLFFNDVFKCFFGQGFLASADGTNIYNEDSLLGNYDAQGIKIRIFIEETSLLAEASFINEIGEWSKPSKAELRTFQFGGFILSGEFSFLNGPVGFFDFDTSGIPQKIRIRHTVCTRRNTQ